MRLEDTIKFYPLALLLWFAAAAFTTYNVVTFGKGQQSLSWILLGISLVCVYNAYSLRRPYEWLWALIWTFAAFIPFCDRYCKLDTSVIAVSSVVLVVVAFAFQRWCQDQKLR